MYCSVCKGNFCEECEKAHSNLLKYHTKYVTRDFLQVSSIPKEPERCPLHPTRPLDLFCPTHYVLCCSKCNLGKGGTHKGCPAVPFDEEDNIKSVYCNLETDISTLTNKIETMLGPIMAAIAKNQDKSQENVVSVKAEVVAAFDRIRDALKTREEALLQEIEKMSEGSSLSWVVTKINDMDEEAKKNHSNREGGT